VAAEIPHRYRGRRPIRLSTLVIGVVVLLAGAGFFYLRSANRLVTVYAAVTDLPPYQQIRRSDIAQIRIPTGAAPANAIVERAELLDHYTLQAIAPNEVFSEHLLGPKLTPGALHGLVFVALSSTSETSLGGQLARGDRVDILLSPTAASVPARSGKLADAIVVDVRRNAVILGITAANENLLQDSLGTSRLVLVLVRAYPGQ
jgi:Flp pilus assembly protein CpaB